MGSEGAGGKARESARSSGVSLTIVLLGGKQVQHSSVRSTRSPGAPRHLAGGFQVLAHQATSRTPQRRLQSHARRVGDAKVGACKHGGQVTIVKGGIMDARQGGRAQRERAKSGYFCVVYCCWDARFARALRERKLGDNRNVIRGMRGVRDAVDDVVLCVVDHQISDLAVPLHRAAQTRQLGHRAVLEPLIVCNADIDVRTPDTQRWQSVHCTAVHCLPM